MSSLYTEWSKAQLKAECEKRGLKNTGGKEFMVERLETFDALKRSGSGMKKREGDEEGRSHAQEEKNNAFLLASRKGSLEEVCAALDDGAKANARDNKRITALMWACARSIWKVSDSVIRELLKRGALVDMHAENGWTPLHWGAMYASAASIALLIESKAPVNALSLDGGTPLIICCYTRMDEDGLAIARLLLENGANVGNKDSKGNTALTFACWRGSAPMVELLLANKAPVNDANNYGATPLIYATCLNRHAGEAIVPLLMAAGADVNCEDKDGKTALRYAFENVGGMMMQIVSNYIAPKGQLKNLLPAADCADPIGSMREGATYGFAPQASRFGERVQTNSTAPVSWAMLRANPLCMDLSANDIFIVMAASDDAKLWYLVVWEVGATRHPTTGDTLLHVAARTGKEFAVDMMIRGMLINPFLRNHANQQAVDVCGPYRNIVAKLNAYSQFQPTRTHIAWFGPYYRGRAFTFLCIVTRWHNERTRSLGRNVILIILRHLGRVEYV